MVLINDNSAVLQIGDPLPHFSLPTTYDHVINTQSIREPVFVIVFTCNHCPYAQAYEDRLMALSNEFRPAGVFFILISSNDAANYPDDSFEEMKKRHEERSFPFPYAYDETQDVAKSFGALCTPHCFVFDRDRKLRYKGRVDDNWKEPDAVTEHNLRDAIEAVLQNREPPKMEANAIGCSIKWKQ